MKYKVFVICMDARYTINWYNELGELYKELKKHISYMFPCNYSIDSCDVGKLIVEIDNEQYNRYKLTTPIDEQFDLRSIDMLYTNSNHPEEEIDGFQVGVHLGWKLEWYPITDS